MSAVGSLGQQHEAMQVQHLTPVEVAIATCHCTFFVVYPVTFLSVLAIPTNIFVHSEYNTETLNKLSVQWKQVVMIVEGDRFS